MEMRCETDCDSKIDITDELSSFALDEWHTLSIRLGCFEKLGATMDKIIAPFGLKTNGKNKFSIANVNIVPHPLENESFDCS